MSEILSLPKSQSSSERSLSEDPEDISTLAVGPVTERLTLHVKPGAIASFDESMALLFDIVKTQSGFSDACWGRYIENPDMVEVLLHWDSIGDHIRFSTDDKFITEEGKLMYPHLAGQPTMYHISFSPAAIASRFLNSPAVQMVTVYGLWDRSKEEELGRVLDQFSDEGVLAKGPVVEEIKLDESSEVGMAVVIATGWDGVKKPELDWTNQIGQGLKVEVHNVKFVNPFS